MGFSNNGLVNNVSIHFRFLKIKNLINSPLINFFFNFRNKLKNISSQLKINDFTILQLFFFSSNFLNNLDSSQKIGPFITPNMTFLILVKYLLAFKKSSDPLFVSIVGKKIFLGPKVLILIH